MSMTRVLIDQATFRAEHIRAASRVAHLKFHICRNLKGSSLAPLFQSSMSAMSKLEMPANDHN